MSNIQYNRELTNVIRDRLSLTQRELSDLMDVASYTVQRWEYGSSQPRANHLGILYDISAQNGLTDLPIWKRGEEVVAIKIAENYEGKYTLPVEIDEKRTIGSSN